MLTLSRVLGFRWISVFTILFIFSFPFPHSILPNLGSLLNFPFQLLSSWFGDNILELSNYIKPFDSDSTGLYIHVLLLSVISFFIATLSVFININKSVLVKSKQWFYVFITYYLASVLLIYGFDKVFKHQFYLPEPNTLYTPLGDLSKDIAFWSIMGASRSYSVYSGIIEIVPAVLLLFNRTRVLGSLIALMVLINVVVINFGFDISVKIFSGFLLLLALIIVLSKGSYLFNFFISGLKIPQKALLNKEWSLKLKLINLLMIAVLLTDALYPYIKNHNYNDNLSERPLFHGAYHIDKYLINEQEIKKHTHLFIHRKGYLILKSNDDYFTDYKLYTDTTNKNITLVDYNKNAYKLKYIEQNEKLLGFKGEIGSNNIEINLTEIDWKQKALLQDNFSWTSD